jgi:hypothetical protein
MNELCNENNIFHSKNSGILIAVGLIKDTVSYKSCFYSTEHDKNLEKYLKIDDKINFNCK